jgi:hypothetical protein
MVLLLAVAALRVATPVVALAVGSLRLPQWDMAKYGVSGLRLARALQDLDPIAFLRHLNGLDVWPPVFPLLEVPAFLLAGPGYASARALVALLFVAAIAAAFWCGLQSDLAVGALTAALVATSPMAQVFATVVMLEIPGTLLLLLTVGWYLRSLATGCARDFTLACVAATALFFCKYNFGLIWILPMAANELLRAHGTAELKPSAMLERLGSAVRRPWPAFLAVGLLVAAAIEITGPFRFSIGSRAVSVSSAGPLLYALYALTLIRWSMRPRRSLRAGRRWLGRLGPRARTMVLTIVLPIALWMVVPSHAVNFVGFVVNRTVGPPVLSIEGLLFYPRVFVSDFSPSPAIGVAVLLFAAASLRRLRSADEVGRVLALALLFSSIAVVAHPFKHPRFFFMTATLLWLAGSREALQLVARTVGRFGPQTRRSVAAAIAGASLVAVSLVAVDIDRLQRGHHRRTVHASTADVLDAITDEAAEVRSSVLLGTWNHLSPWLVEWSFLQRGGSMEPTQMPRCPTGRAQRGNVLGGLGADPPELVMLLSAAPDSAPRAGFRAETGWLDPVRRQLVHDPRFDLVSRRDFAVARYRLESFKPALSATSHSDEEASHSRTEGEPAAASTQRTPGIRISRPPTPSS